MFKLTSKAQTLLNQGLFAFKSDMLFSKNEIIGIPHSKLLCLYVPLLKVYFHYF